MNKKLKEYWGTDDDSGELQLCVDSYGEHKCKPGHVFEIDARYTDDLDSYIKYAKSLLGKKRLGNPTYAEIRHGDTLLWDSEKGKTEAGKMGVMDESMNKKLVVNNKVHLEEAFKRLNESVSDLSYEDVYDFLYPIVHDKVIGYAMDNLALKLQHKYPEKYTSDWCNNDGNNQSAEETYSAQDALTEALIYNLLYLHPDNEENWD